MLKWHRSPFVFFRHTTMRLWQQSTAHSERPYVFGCLFIYSPLVDQSDRIRLPLPYLTTRNPSNGEKKPLVSVCFSHLKHEQSNQFSKKKIIINLHNILPSFLPQTRKEKTDHYRSIDGLHHDSRNIQFSLVTAADWFIRSSSGDLLLIFDQKTSADVHSAFLRTSLSPVALVLCR